MPPDRQIFHWPALACEWYMVGLKIEFVRRREIDSFNLITMLPVGLEINLESHIKAAL